MIKLCKVLFFNKTTHIVVAMFGETQIQFETNKDSVDSSCYIKEVDSGYEIVTESEYKAYVKAKKKKPVVTEEVAGIIGE